MGEIVHIGDSVAINFNFGWDVGFSNNSARAVVADALRQNGLLLTQYDNSQVGFTGGPASLTVLLQASDYGDKQDVAGAVAGIFQGSLGLTVTGTYAVGVYRGATSQPLTVDAGAGSYTPMRTPSSRPSQQQIPTIDANPWVLGVVNIPIPPDPVYPPPYSQDWIDKLAQQLGASRSTVEITGSGSYGVAADCGDAEINNQPNGQP